MTYVPNAPDDGESVLVLVHYDDNWADEMDMEGFQIQTREEWNAYVKAIRKEKFPRRVYYGSNQEAEISSADEHLGAFSVHSITEAEAEVIRKFIGGNEFGQYKELEPDYDDNDEDEEDEETVGEEFERRLSEPCEDDEDCEDEDEEAPVELQAKATSYIEDYNRKYGIR